jgi:antitoxin PrlF
MDFHYFYSMAMLMDTEANLTAQNQITVPAAVRKVLHLRGGTSRVKFEILKGGRVLVYGVNPDIQTEEDPALRPFLDLLSKDMTKHPKRLAPFPAKLLTRAQKVLKGVKVDLNGPLTGEE